MTHYYAYDMTNGKTIIGHPKKYQSSDSPDILNLENVVITETATNRELLSTGHHIYIDIKEKYINIYRDVVKNKKFDLPSINLQRTGPHSTRPLQYNIIEWYLGEDILKEKKTIKGDI
jgi:hypothetical protein